MFGEITNQQGERIDYSFHPGKADSKDLVVIGHGVTGNKDRPFVVALAEGLANAGIPALRISFSGNGASGGKFTDSTVSKEVSDLGSVLEVLSDRRICYAGHSMGGAVGVLRASQDGRIRLLVSLAGMVHTKAFADREFGSVKPGEGCMWDEPACPLSQAYMDDMAKIDSVADRAPQIKVPWLLVHGIEDDVVPIQDSYDIFRQANDPVELIEIKGSNHVFAGEFAAIMVEKVTAWVKLQLTRMK
jgi:alpha/beta superfamily hydrolase